MILDFVKDENGRWFANAEVNADFAIHIEKNNDGALYVSYSSVAGGQTCESRRPMYEGL